MARKKKKYWNYIAGERPHTVEVREYAVGGLLHARAWNPVLKKQVNAPLRHRDRDAAKAYADREAKKLAAGAEKVTPAAAVGYVLMQYLVHRTPRKKSAESRRADVVRAELWRTLLGPQRRIATLGSAEWYDFIRDRASGAIDARGRRIPEEGVKIGGKLVKRQPVEERTVGADLVFIVAVLNWATSWKMHGVPILDRNPWGGGAPGVKRSLEVPKSLAPARPVATYDRFLVVRAAAEQVMMECRKNDPQKVRIEVGRAQYKHGEGPVVKWMKPSYLPELLDLVEDTGRRISAICRLWYSDFIREGDEVTKIRWRPFKAEKETIIPLGARARAAVKRILEQRPGIGDAPVFPSSRGKGAAIGKRTATDWLYLAEKIAGVPSLERGAFHPYRRKWEIERKHLPEADVMAAQGRRDVRSLRESYRLADDETMLAVVNEPRKLVEKKA